MCPKNKLHLLVLHFLPLVVTNNPGGDETGLIRTMVAAAVCSVPGHNTVSAGADGAGLVSAVGVSLKTPSGSVLLIVDF